MSNMIGKDNEFEDLSFLDPGQCNWKLENDIHVWQFPLTMAGESLLSESELMIGRKFRFEADRNRFFTGRRSVRLLLSKYLCANPLDIRIVAEKGEKPFIKNPETSVRFNISHSGQWVVIALSNEELGIDIEKIDLSFDYFNLLEDHFTLAEQEFIVNAGIPSAAFYYLWTRKEALIKAIGMGLQDSLREVSTLDETDFPGMPGKKWKIKSFSLRSEYPVALAYCGLPANICFFDGTRLITDQVQSK